MDNLDKLLKINQSLAQQKIDFDLKLAREVSSKTFKTEVQNFPTKMNVQIEGVEIITLKGDKGDEGIPGKDANEEKIIKEILAKIPKPRDGQTPTIDYEKIIKDTVKRIPRPKDGQDGRDAVVDYDQILLDVLSQIPTPKDGEPGKDGSTDTPEEIRTKLEMLEGDNRLDASFIKNLPKPIGRVGGGGSSLIVRKESGQVEQFVNDIDFKGSGVTTAKTGDGKVTVTIAGGGGSFADRETPTPAVDDVTVAFTLAHTPTAGSEHVYLNGVLLDVGASNDYTISGATVTLAVAPASTDKLRVSYRY